MHPLIRRLLMVDEAALAAVVAAADAGDDARLLVAVALFTPDGGGCLDRARDVAVTARERQLTAIAAAHLRGEHALVDALARDHLVDHPDDLLVAWIAGASRSAREDQ